MPPAPAHPPDFTPHISVVIPVRNGARDLPTQLEALAQQELDADFEVIVSDNGSTDDTAAVARLWRPRFRGLRIVDSSEEAGVAHARNVGAAAAQSSKIAFCDADDRAAPGWLAAIAAGLEAFDMVGGVADTRTINSLKVQSLASTPPLKALPNALRYLPYAIGANLGVRKSVLQAVGGFDGSFIGGHEEVDFAWRVQRAGYTLGFVPQAVMHYRLRETPQSMRRQRYNYGRSNAQLHGRYRDTPGVPPFTRRRALRVILHHLKSLPALQNPATRQAWLSEMAWHWGRLRGTVTYHGDERRAPLAGDL